MYNLSIAGSLRVLISLLTFILIIGLNPIYAQDNRDVESTAVTKSRFFCDQNAPFGKKVLRAEIMSFTLQGLGYVGLAAMPSTTTHWSFDNVGWNYRYAFTHPPVWDHDSWVFNYVGHPITGAVHYSILRSQDVPILQSFAYSTAQSVIWEFLMESSQEPPSIQDLMFTSTIGSVIGELIHQATLAMKKKKFRTIEKIVVTIINPMYVVNNGYKPTHEKAKWVR